MRRATFLLALSFMSLATARAQAPVAKLDDLAWLEGRWEGEQDGLLMEEHWTSLKGGALLGLHRDVKRGRMVSFEFLRIQATPQGIVYFASPRSQPPVAFALVEAAQKRAVFENKQHDFPQRILYWLDADGAMHARIEGAQGGKRVSEEWVWKKARP
jgi:Domain of unknown function (DUF6265)